MQLKRQLGMITLATLLSANFLSINATAYESNIQTILKEVKANNNNYSFKATEDFVMDISDGFVANGKISFNNNYIFSGFKGTEDGYYSTLIKTDSNYNNIKEIYLTDYDTVNIECLNYTDKTSNGVLVMVDYMTFAEYDNDLNLINEHIIDFSQLGLDYYEIQPISVKNNKLFLTVSNYDEGSVDVFKYDLSTKAISKVTSIKDMDYIVAKESNNELAIIGQNIYGNYQLIEFSETGKIVRNVILPNIDIYEIYDFQKYNDDYIVKYSDSSGYKLVKTQGNAIDYEVDISLNDIDRSNSVIDGNYYYSLDVGSHEVAVIDLTDGSLKSRVELPFQDIDYQLRGISKDSKSLYIEMSYYNYSTNNVNYAVVRLDSDLRPIAPSGSSSEIVLGVSTNQIVFDDYNGIEDSVSNDVSLTVSSSLPYDINAMMLEEFKGTKDTTAIIDSSNLSIKLSEEDISEYKSFSVGEEVLILSNAPKGENMEHSLTFKMKADGFVKADCYKTKLQFSVNQR